jgi:hypothetical protein
VTDGKGSVVPLRWNRAMGGLEALLLLLYGAHHRTDALFLDVRDWSLAPAGSVLIAQGDAARGATLRWAEGSLYPTPAGSARHLWFQQPSRIRVDVLRNERVVRTGVRDGAAWWRWDETHGDSFGDLRTDTPLPPLLAPTLLAPARLLQTIWFTAIGTGSRAGRQVLTATGHAREGRPDTRQHLEFEFDAEHGTPLRVAAFAEKQCLSETLVQAVRYGGRLDPDTFRIAGR